MRVRHVRAGHADHVQFARGNRITRRRDVLDLGRVEGRKPGGGPYLAGKIEVRGTRHALHRDHVGEAGVGVDVAPNHVEEVHHAAVLEAARDLEAVGPRQPAGQAFVGGVTHAHDERRADPVADRAQHLEGEAQPVVERAAVRRVELVGQGRPELVHQVSVGLQLDAVQPRGDHAFGRVGIVAHDAFNIPGLHLFGERPVRGLAVVRRRHHRQPVRLGPVGAAPQVGELQHHGAAVFVAGVAEVLEPGHDIVAVGQDVVEYRRAVARDGGRAGRHGQRDAGPGALHMVGAVALLGHAVLGVRRFVRGGHDAVLEPQVFELVGLQQRVVLGCHVNTTGRSWRPSCGR